MMYIIIIEKYSNWNFYGIWFSNNNLIHMKKLLWAHIKYFFWCSDPSRRNFYELPETCIKVHRVLSTFCHVIVEKIPLFRTCGFFWKCTDDEFFGEQWNYTENKAITLLWGNKSLASDTKSA